MLRSALIMMLLLVIVSACALVYVHHQHRLTFMDLQASLKQRDQLNTEWGQLLLEQSTFSFHHYVNATARKRLGMRPPAPEDVIVLDDRALDLADKAGVHE